MAVICRSRYSWRRAARLGALAMVFSAALVFVIGAQTPQTPSAQFQYSNLTGSGNTINATHIPVVTASGVTVYVNLAMQFNVDANGNLTLSSGFPQATLFPALLTTSFVAGKYVGPSAILSGKTSVIVSGPGVTDGGATEWSLSAAAGADNCTYPSSATWYVGPIANNPLAARITKAGITSTALSYGVGSSQCSTDAAWGVNTLIGVSQIGNSITFVSFNRVNSNDLNIPVSQITYNLAP
jgi:hypothetical protein